MRNSFKSLEDQQDSGWSNDQWKPACTLPFEPNFEEHPAAFHMGLKGSIQACRHGVFTRKWPAKEDDPSGWEVGAHVFSHGSATGYMLLLLLLLSHSVVFNSVRPYGLQPARLLCPLDSPGKSTGVGCRALLQGVFPTQGSNRGLLHCRQILYYWATRASPCPTFNTQC